MVLLTTKTGNALKSVNCVLQESPQIMPHESNISDLQVISKHKVNSTKYLYCTYMPFPVLDMLKSNSDPHDSRVRQTSSRTATKGELTLLADFLWFLRKKSKDFLFFIAFVLTKGL